MTDSRFMGTAVGGALVVHLTAYVIAVLLLLWKGVPGPNLDLSESFEVPAPLPEERTMITPDMIIVEETATAEGDEGKENKPDAFVDATGMTETAVADPEARLEADRTTAAASDSDAPPNPDAPAGLPWQKGENIASVHIVVAASTGAAPIRGDGDVTVSDPVDSGPQDGTGADEVLLNAMRGSAPRGEEVAVAAVETPRARYQTAVNKALTESKNRVVARAPLPEGSAKVLFHVDRQGRKLDARFAEPPSDPRIGDAALDAVLEARLPPIPDELFEELPDGKMPFTIDFISYR